MSEKVQAAAKKPEAKSENKVSKMQNAGPSQSISSPIDQIMFLQRTIGNQAVGKLLKSGTLQAKLKIGQLGDIYEQEADRMAEQVMRIPDSHVSNETKVSNPARNNSIQRKCPGCNKGTKVEKEEEDEKLQKKESSGSTPEVTPELESSISAVRGGGQPLPESVRAFYEPRFGHDFSQVRVHTGTQAAETAKSINSRAFTVGGNIAFGTGQYSSESHEGRRLLAHELTHVVQQRQATISIQRDATDTPQKAKLRALAIKDALLDHWTEDEEAALNQIRNQSILMLKEIRAEYNAVTGGHSLVEDFKEYTSSSEFKEALGLLNAVLPLEDRLRTNINKGWLFNTENEKGMLEVLRLASRPELDEAAKTPSVMTLLRNSLNDNEYYQARKLLTPGEMYEIVVEMIKNAKSFWGDDESAAYNAVLDLKPQERRRLWEENEQLFSFMSEDEKKSAEKMCMGTEAAALKERMKVATEGLGTDDEALKLVVDKTQSSAQTEQAIKRAIESGKTPDGKLLTAKQIADLQAQQSELGGIEKNLLTAEYEEGKLKSGSFLEMLNDDVSGGEYQSFAGAMGVSEFQLVKQQVLDAIGLFNDDEEAIYKAFDRLVGRLELPAAQEMQKLTPELRAQAQKLANQKLRQKLLDDPDIKAALKAHLNEDELKEVSIYASADTYQIALKKLEAAYHGVDTDEEGIFKILTEMSAADRKRMTEEQPRIYFDLLYAPSSSLTGEEQEMAKIAIDTGKIPTDKALNWAFGGWGDGTEEEMLQQTFAAMDETERYQYRLGYFLFKGGSLPVISEEQRKQEEDAKAKFGKLYERMDAELGTDDLQKALDQLLDSPTLEELKTEQGRLMAAGIMGYRVGEKGDIREGDTMSSAIIDIFSESGEVSDQSEARFVSAYRQAMADGKLTDEEFSTLAALDADFAEKYQSYVASVDQVANIASTVAAIAVGIVVTVASGGTAGPATASLLAQYGASALIGGVAGAATKVGVSEAVSGEHYDTFSTEGLTGAVSGFADGAVAVLSAGLAARFTSLIGLGKSALAAEMTTGILLTSRAALAQAGKTFVSAGVRSTIEGFLSGAVGELIMTSADETTWKQSIWGVIQTYGLNILKSGGMGAATGLITGGTLEALGAYVGVKRVQALVGQLEAAGLSQQRMSVMSLRSVWAIGQADAALAAGKLDEAAKALATLRGEMSPNELDNLWQTLGRHHTGKDVGKLPGSASSVPSGTELPSTKPPSTKPPRLTELPPEEVSRLVSQRSDGTFRLNRKRILNANKIIGEPEATVTEHAAREAYAAERAASMNNVEGVYMGREADRLINPNVPLGTELSADVVGVTRQGKYVLIESKGTEILHGLEQLEHSAQALGLEQVVRYELVVPEVIRTPGFTVRNSILHLNEKPYLINNKLVHVRTTIQGR